MRKLVALVLLSVLVVLPFEGRAQAAPELDAVADEDKPAVVTLNQKFMGVDLKVPVKMDLHASTSSERLDLRVNMDADLASLQSNAGRLVQSLDVIPRNNCRTYARNVVIDPKSIELFAEGSEVVAKVKGNADIWECQKGAPSATVSWKNKCWRVLGRKMCTKVPVSVKTHHGSDIKLKLIDADFTAIVPFSLDVLDGGTKVQIRPGRAKVIVPNSIVNFLDDIAGIFDSSATHILQKQLTDAVNGGDLGVALPENVAAYKPKVESASFYRTDAGAIGLRTAFVASLSQDQINELLGKLLAAQ